MKLILMAFFWGIIGWVIVCFPALGRDPIPPCPKLLRWKCFVAFVFGVIGGLGYYYLMGFKDAFTSIDFIAGSIWAAVLARFVYLWICPIGKTTT